MLSNYLDMISQLKTFGTALLCDAIEKVLHTDLLLLSSEIHPISSTSVVAGPVQTVLLEMGYLTGVLRALEQLKPGHILFIAADERENCAVMGEMISRDAQRSGAEAIVTNGLVRDVQGIVEAGFPVFARGITARAANFKENSFSIDIPIKHAGGTINPGDILVANADGGIVFSSVIVPKLVQVASQIHETEKAIVAKIKAGVPLTSIKNVGRPLDTFIESTGVDNKKRK